MAETKRVTVKLPSELVRQIDYRRAAHQSGTDIVISRSSEIRDMLEIALTQPMIPNVARTERKCD